MGNLFCFSFVMHLLKFSTKRIRLSTAMLIKTLILVYFGQKWGLFAVGDSSYKFSGLSASWKYFNIWAPFFLLWQNCYSVKLNRDEEGPIGRRIRWRKFCEIGIGRESKELSGSHPAIGASSAMYWMIVTKRDWMICPKFRRTGTACFLISCAAHKMGKLFWSENPFP